MKSLFILSIVCLSMLSCESKKEQTTAETEDVTPEEKPVTQGSSVTLDKAQLQELMAENPDVQVVDVRTANETSMGHIEGALIGMDFLSGEFKNKMNSLDKDKPVVVYCAKGGRSAKAAQQLIDDGYTVVYDYSGGYTDWAADQ